MRRIRGPVAVVVVVLLVLAAIVVVWRWPGNSRRVVAHFSRTVGIHTGSDVRILGVKIGEIVAVKPEGRSVRVEMRYDAGRDIAADSMAVVIPPSVVADRYVQLTPARPGGGKLPDNADLPLTRTAVPLELDEVYQALDDLNKALGPDGANSGGALAGLVHTGRANLDGNGQALHDTLDGFSKAMDTLAGNRDDLFGTLDDLQKFTTTLARSDEQVRLFNQQLAGVSEQLAGERDELALALRNLATALADVTGFVHDNRELLKSNVDKLADLTGVLARQKQAIIDTLDFAPLALQNLNLSYNPRSGTTDTRDNAMGPYDPASYVCSLMVNAVPVAQVPKACVDLAKTLQSRQLPLSNELRKLLGLPATGGAASTSVPATPSTPSTPAAPPVTGGVDPTLGGILK